MIARATAAAARRTTTALRRAPAPSSARASPPPQPAPRPPPASRPRLARAVSSATSRRRRQWRPPRDDSYFPRSFAKRVLREGEHHLAKPGAAGAAAPLRHRGPTLAGLEAPTFPVRADDITVLSTPGDFYDALLRHSRGAQDRVSIASLYLGTGAKEREFADALAENCAQNDALRVRFVLDRNRGTRPDPGAGPGGASSAAVLAPHVEADSSGGRFTLGLFDMPLGQGDWFTRFVLPRLPPRYNELLHTFHLKAYVFDDTLIMSGANLSGDYFTTRQDRYWVIRDARLASFYHDLVSALHDASRPHDCGPRRKEEPLQPRAHFDQLRTRMGVLLQSSPSASFLATTAATTTTTTSSSTSPQTTRRTPFTNAAADYYTGEGSSAGVDGGPGWAYVRPTLQCASLGVRTDERLTLALLARLDDMGANAAARGLGAAREHRSGAAWFSSGYLNLADAFLPRLLSMETPVRVLAACPQANGFFGARGIAGSLPMAYSLIEQRLFRKAMRRTRARGSSDAFQITEYMRDGWTYHAKGLWFLELEKDALRGGGSHSSTNSSVSDSDEDRWRTGPTFDAETMGYGVAADSLLGDVRQDGVSGGALTLVGSPNFGCRSVERDFESQLLVVTDDVNLRGRMRTELDGLLAHTSHVDDNTFRQRGRKLRGLASWTHGWWISPASRLVRRYM